MMMREQVAVHPPSRVWGPSTAFITTIRALDLRWAVAPTEKVRLHATGADFWVIAWVGDPSNPRPRRVLGTKMPT